MFRGKRKTRWSFGPVGNGERCAEMEVMRSRDKYFGVPKWWRDRVGQLQDAEVSTVPKEKVDKRDSTHMAGRLELVRQ